MADTSNQDSSHLYQLWEKVCKEVLQDNFNQWYPLYEIDIETGNPIYSIYQPTTNKALRIIHSEGASQSGVYTRKAGTADMVDDKIDEIVFCLPYTESAIVVFKLALRLWIDVETDISYMEIFIRRSKISYQLI